MSSQSVDLDEALDSAVGGGDAAERRPDEPIQGGRRLGDDPFLQDEGFFWWLPRTFSLLVVAVGLMLLGAHFFGAESVAVSSSQGEPAQNTAAAQAPSPAASPASPTASPGSASALGSASTSRFSGGSLPPSPLSRVAPVRGQPNSLAASRSYNARRRALLQEGEDLLRVLPAEGTGDLERERDRRALREFIQRMDTPAR